MTARAAVVTGGTRGIGAAVARALDGEGYRVAAVYAGNDERARAFRAETGIPVYKWDVSDFAACEAGVARVAADIGPVEVLINNAGITRDGTMHRMTHDMWQAVIDTNIGSCFNMARCVIDEMRERGFGRIVNIGSINGQAGQYGQVNYAAAKSGIHGFTKALAQEGAARGITVNAIAPGYIDTDMVAAVPDRVLKRIVERIPVGRLGRAGGNCPRGGLPRRRRRRVHHRLHPLDQRRPAYVLESPPSRNPPSSEADMTDIPTVRMVEYEDADDTVRAVYDDIMARRGISFVPNFWKTVAVHPPTLGRLWKQLDAVMAPGRLDPLTKEMVAIAVSATNGCEYCTWSHTASARKLGLDDETLGELMSVIGLFNQTNSMASGMRVPPDEVFKKR